MKSFRKAGVPRVCTRGVRRQVLRIIAIVAIGANASTASWAQAPLESAAAFPSKAMRIIVPFPPGGGSDTFSRMLSQKLAAKLAQPFIVDNRPGGSTVIGGGIAARAPADGHTVFVATFINSIVPILATSATWDIRKDLKPVSLLTTNTYVLVVNPAFPATTVQELLKQAKALPNGVDYASQGNGTPGHLAGELFKSLTGAPLVHIPYAGTAPSISAVLGGQVPITFGNTFATIPHIRSGKFRALAVTSAARVPLLPEIPTMKEAGVPRCEILGWYGWMVPAGTPPAIVAKLRKELIDVFETPDVKAFIAKEGSTITTTTPEQFTTFLNEEISKWSDVVKTSGLKLN